ncbi:MULTISPECIES: hypothetical protein [unclassified Sphingomonas]|uniref:hypothetical protein n=1 Tax=unclassified Sphingomonas TaxID=196159 RepID=UPI002151F8A6|nr:MULTISPECIES: hypothetical protein [unclassified Sphingomonas]MCR5872285.1 hypothetical protein [Sphingomonas sp. J344]UUX99415.1 hypothetical protein LRS08_18550 [Sphingomonas sp. J315]
MVDNTVTQQQFAEMKKRFSGKMEPDEAMQVLRAAADDKELPPIVRLHLASAMLDLRGGRSVQSTMARFRRAVGLDPEKKLAGS